MSSKKMFYADDFYKDENGNYYTGEYIDHNSYIKDRHTLTLLSFRENGGMSYDDFTKEITGKTVLCNYDQIFGHGSQMILCNNIVNAFDCEEIQLENGSDYDEENEEYTEIYQYWIIDDNTAQQLEEHTDEIVFYIEKLDIYVLGVTHYGTSWDYVGTEFVY